MRTKGTIQPVPPVLHPYPEINPRPPRKPKVPKPKGAVLHLRVPEDLRADLEARLETHRKATGLDTSLSQYAAMLLRLGLGVVKL